MPLWVIYEILTLQINDGWGGVYRTGTDYLLRNSFGQLDWPSWMLDILFLTCLTVFLFLNKNQLKLPKRKPTYFGLMFLESTLYGSVLGLIVGSVAGIFLNQGTIQIREDRIHDLIINLGSGVYEELVFRLFLIALLVVALRKLFKANEVMTYSGAIIISSVVFAFYHYLDFFSEPFATHSFVFRFFAGVLFSLIFIFRGYGIAAYTHSLYNIFLMFRST